MRRVFARFGIVKRWSSVSAASSATFGVVEVDRAGVRRDSLAGAENVNFKNFPARDRHLLFRRPTSTARHAILPRVSAGCYILKLDDVTLVCRAEKCFVVCT